MAPSLKIRSRLRACNCDGRYGASLLAICGLALALQSFGSAAIRLLRYDRAAISAGEWWRLLTAHLIHFDLRHAALDLAGLVLLWVLFARDLGFRAWLIVILSAVAAVDCGLWLWDPWITWYLGLSGVLHGVLAAAIVVRLRRREIEGWSLGALLLAKLGYEQIHGALPFAGDMPVLVDAHLFGALGGLAAAILLDLFSRSAPARPAAGDAGPQASESGRAAEGSRGRPG